MNKICVVKIAKNNRFAIGRINEDDYIWFEIIHGEINVEDILDEVELNAFGKMGNVDCIINKKLNGKICIEDIGELEIIKEQYSRYDN